MARHPLLTTVFEMDPKAPWLLIMGAPKPPAILNQKCRCRAVNEETGPPDFLVCRPPKAAGAGSVAKLRTTKLVRRIQRLQSRPEPMHRRVETPIS